MTVDPVEDLFNRYCAGETPHPLEVVNLSPDQLGRLQTLIGGDEELIRRIFIEGVATLKRAVAEMREALAEDDGAP